MAALPTYVSRLGHGEVSIRQPAAIADARVTMFGVPIDRRTAQQYVDFVLSDRGGPSYHVLGDTALFCFLHSPKASSNAQTIGFVADHEVAVWLPLVERVGSRVRFVVWMPYIWLDTDIGMASGREIWGFPKSIGTFSPPTVAGQPYELSTRIFRTFAPTTEGEVVNLITVAPATLPGESEWHEIEDLARGLAQALDLKDASTEFKLGEDVKLLIDLVELAASRTLPVVNLKQFRDAADGSKACYQAIIQSTLGITSFKGGGPLLGDHEIELVRCASHDLIGDLGLPGESFRARFGAWVEMGFTANAGEAVWEAKV